MGGFFGATSRRNCILDVFFGTDYHSHLGTRRGGMAAWDKDVGMQREIHNIQNSPFRTKFEGILDEMTGTAAIGCISDTDPQPLLIRSELGTYAICTIGTEIFPETDTGLNRSSKTIIADGFSDSLKPVAGTAVNPFFSILTESSYEIGVSASCFGLAVNVGDGFVSLYPTDTFVIPVDHISGSV